MDFDDTPEEAAFRDQVRAWFDAHARPRDGQEALTLFSQEPEDPELIARARAWQRKLYEGGWAGLTWPAAYGGQEKGLLESLVFGEEAGRYEVPPDLCAIGINMIGPTIIEHGTEEQKQRYLEPMLRGDEVWCQLWSEPDAGSDLAGLRARAEVDTGRGVAVLNGQKVWTSGAHYSEFGLGLFRTNPDVPKHQGISCFIVDMASPGVTVRPLRQMTGGADFNEVFFDDVEVPLENLVGERDDGWSVARTLMLYERMAVGSLAHSPSTVFEPLRGLAHKQRRGDGAALEDPVLRQELAEVYTRGRLFDLTLARVRTSLAQGGIPGPEGSILKLTMGQLTMRQASLAIDVLGPDGLLRSPDAPEGGRWTTILLGAPGVRLGGGTDEIQRSIIGEQVLGLPREPATDRKVPFRDVH